MNDHVLGKRMASSGDRGSASQGWSIWQQAIVAFPTTLRSLTVFAPSRRHRAVGANAVFYPVVGFLLGAVALLVDGGIGLIAGFRPRSVAAWLTLLSCTGGRPQLALGQLIEASLLRRRRPAAVRLLEEDADGIAKALAAATALIELLLLFELDRYRWIALLLGPLLAHCSMVVLAVGSRAARSDGRRIKLAPGLTFNEFAIASTLTFAVVFLSSDFLGLLLVLTTAFVTIALRVLFHRWLDGVNTTLLDASSAVSLLATWALLACF